MNLASIDIAAESVVEWHDREWLLPDGTEASIEKVSMKLTEEVGELQGALVKHLQGRTDKDWMTEARKEFGDVVIVLMVLADRIADLSDPVRKRRVSVRTNDVTFGSMFSDRFYGDDDNPGVSERRGASYRD